MRPTRLHWTPGPWIVETHATAYPDIQEYSIVAPRGYWDEARQDWQRCSVAGGAFDSKADARLIAAAPDLYETLARLVTICRSVLSPAHNSGALPDMTDHDALVQAYELLASLEEGCTLCQS